MYCLLLLEDIESNKTLWNGLREGEIQIVATDHCAFNYKGQKELGLEDFY